jgi:two-component system response regulator YesN
MDIVIVDDEPKIRNGLSKLLNGRKNWHVIGVYGDAMDALKNMAVKSPDVIITDIRMPEINGLDMIDRLKEADQDAYIIILSGYSDFGFAQRAIELGVTRYLTKPTKKLELFKALEEIERKLSEKQDQQEEKLEVTNLMVQKSMDYIALNYSRKISLKSIAAELYLSPNYLSELFKRHTGKNISEYITEYRLDKARRYLQQPEYKIGEVAELVGFGEARYFSSMFKKQYGMTPNEYRNRKVK